MRLICKHKIEQNVEVEIETLVGDFSPSTEVTTASEKAADILYKIIVIGDNMMRLFGIIFCNFVQQ